MPGCVLRLLGGLDEVTHGDDCVGIRILGTEMG